MSAESDKGSLALNRGNPHERVALYVQAMALAGIVALWLLTATPLIDRNYLYSFEPDSSKLIEFTIRFRDFLHNPFAGLPSLSAYPPYFDAPFFIYAAATDVVLACRSVGIIAFDSIPTHQSAAIFAIRHLNALCDLLAAIFLFRCVRQYTRNSSIALFAAATSLLSFQVLNIDFIRIDHLILSLFTLCLALCFELYNNPSSRATLYAIAISAAVLSLTKLNAVELSLPVVAFAYYLIGRQGKLWPQIKRPTIAAFAVAICISIRYLRQPLDIIPNLCAKFQGVSEWNVVIPRRPYFHYSIGLFENNGTFFMLLSALGLTTLVILAAKRRLRTIDAFILSSFLYFTIIGIVSMKFNRGGYQLVPIYALLCAVFLNLASRWTPIRPGFHTWILGYFAPLCALFIFVAQSIPDYIYLADRHAGTTAAIVETRLLPREWLSAHIRPGAKVVIPVDAEYALPPLDGLRFDVSYGFLNFPYLNRQDLSAYHPPKIESLGKYADVMLLTDLHPRLYLQDMNVMDLKLSIKEWQRFFRNIPEKYPSYLFAASSDCYGISLMRIVILNPRVEIGKLPAEHRSIKLRHSEYDASIPGRQG